MPSHSFFCNGPYCLVMLPTSDKLCEFCKPKPKVDLITELNDDINAIKMKLFTRMTPGQVEQWSSILEKKQMKLATLLQPCCACRNKIKNQLDHMQPGCCLYNGV